MRPLLDRPWIGGQQVRQRAGRPGTQTTLIVGQLGVADMEGEHPPGVGAVGHELEERVDRALESLVGRAGTAHDRGQAVLEYLGAAIDGSAIQLRLRAEVLIDQRLRHAGALGQLGRAHAVITALGKCARTSVQGCSRGVLHR